MKKIIIIAMISLFSFANLSTAAEPFFYIKENRPGNMLIKLNDSRMNVVLAVIGNGQIKITKAGSELFESNTNTKGMTYLNNKVTGENIITVKSTYYKKHRATLHILSDQYGWALVSVTLRGKPGFVHKIDVVEFENDIKDNLENALKSAEEAFEQAIRDGANEATQEALSEAVAEAAKEFSNFENLLINSGLFHNNTYEGELQNGIIDGTNYRVNDTGLVGQIDSSYNYSPFDEDGILNGDGEQANIFDPTV